MLARCPEGDGEQLLGRGEPVALQQAAGRGAWPRARRKRESGGTRDQAASAASGPPEGLLASPEQEMQLPFVRPSRRRFGQQPPGLDSDPEAIRALAFSRLAR